MRKLVSSSEAAEILGISLQGVHYRIKKGHLSSMKKDGKTYVYIEQEQASQYMDQKQSLYEQQTFHNSEAFKAQDQDKLSYKTLNELVLKAKDDQIKELKEIIELVKEQHKNEIDRLDKSQKKILEVFQSEVELLKSAFNEMKTVYQLEHKERMEDKKTYSQEFKTTPEDYELKVESENSDSDDIEIPFMDLKEFYSYMKGFSKTDIQIKNIILERVKAGDKRFIYKRDSKEVIIFRSDFVDLI